MDVQSAAVFDETLADIFAQAGRQRWPRCLQWRSVSLKHHGGCSITLSVAGTTPPPSCSIIEHSLLHSVKLMTNGDDPDQVVDDAPGQEYSDSGLQDPVQDKYTDADVEDSSGSSEDAVPEITTPQGSTNEDALLPYEIVSTTLGDYNNG